MKSIKTILVATTVIPAMVLGQPGAGFAEAAQAAIQMAQAGGPQGEHPGAPAHPAAPPQAPHPAAPPPHPVAPPPVPHAPPPVPHAPPPVPHAAPAPHVEAPRAPAPAPHVEAPRAVPHAEPPHAPPPHAEPRPNVPAHVEAPHQNVPPHQNVAPHADSARPPVTPPAATPPAVAPHVEPGHPGGPQHGGEAGRPGPHGGESRPNGLQAPAAVPGQPAGAGAPVPGAAPNHGNFQRPPGQPVPNAVPGALGQPPRGAINAPNVGAPNNGQPNNGAPGAGGPGFNRQGAGGRPEGGPGAPGQANGPRGGGNAGAIAAGVAAGLAGGFIAGSAARSLDDIHRERRETHQDGMDFIREPGRTIIGDGDRRFIVHDETERFQDLGYNLHRERRGNDNVVYYDAPDGAQILTFTDPEGRLLRRIRRYRDGREVVLLDNSYGGGVRNYSDDIVVLPPPPIGIPPSQYDVDADGADEDMIYNTLTAPPVQPLPQRYTLDQVLYSPDLRARMRSVDINTLTFDTGSWIVANEQVPKLRALADAIKRAVSRNPNEVFLVEGFTDAVGNPTDNLSLSDRRAQSVASLLTREFKVPPENLTTQGYGQQYLKEQTSGPSRINRRVVVQRITPLLAEAGQTPPPPPR